MHSKSSLIYNFPLFYGYKNFTKLLPHWNMAFGGDLNLCSLDVVTRNWLQNKLALIPFEMRAVFFVLTKAKLLWYPSLHPALSPSNLFFLCLTTHCQCSRAALCCSILFYIIPSYPFSLSALYLFIFQSANLQANQVMSLYVLAS